jgi:hypothetical protein
MDIELSNTELAPKDAAHLVPPQFLAAGPNRSIGRLPTDPSCQFSPTVNIVFPPNRNIVSSVLLCVQFRDVGPSCRQLTKRRSE